MIKVFYSYAREDSDDVTLLIRRHMNPMANAGRITHWLDRDIRAGDSWRDEIVEHLDAADVIVLLLSSDFFASEFIADVELPRTWKRWHAGGVTVVPVLLKQVIPENLEPFASSMQILPAADGLTSIHDAPSRDNAWLNVAEGLLTVVDELSGLAGYPRAVAAQMRACYRRLDPAAVDTHLVRRPVPAGEKHELRSERGTRGHRWPFRRASVHWTAEYGAHPVWGAIGDVHDTYGGCTGSLGFPTTDELAARASRWGSTGMVQHFEGRDADGASIYWRTDGDVTCPVTGEIGRAFARLDDTAGRLGFPLHRATTVTSRAGHTGRAQTFEGGAIYARPGGDAHAVTGEMYRTFVDVGGVTGRFGFPVSAQRFTEDHQTQEFEGGAIRVTAQKVVPARQVERVDALSELPLTAVTAGSREPGHQEIVLALRDHRMVGSSDLRGRSPWSTLSGDPGQVAAMTYCSSVDGTGKLYTVDEMGRLRNRQHRQGWSGWVDIPTPGPVTAIAAGSYAEGHQELFVAKVDGSVFHRWQHGGPGSGWSEWTWFRAPVLMRALTCGASRTGHLVLFGIDDDGRLHHRRYQREGAWSDWSTIGTPEPVTALSCAARRDGHRELFVALADGRVLHRWGRDDSWSDWADFRCDARLLALATVSRQNRELEVFGVTGSGTLTRRSYRPEIDEWSDWTDVALPPM